MLFSYKFFTRQFNPRQKTPTIKSHNHQSTTITPPQQQKSKSHRNTNKTQEKKNHNPIKLREEGREGGRSVLGSRTIGFGVWRILVRDRGRRIGAATAIAIGAKAKSNGFEVERRSRSWTANRSSLLSLSLCARARLPLPQLSLYFPENGNLKVK